MAKTIKQMKIQGLPQHLSKYYLAVFYYSATCEGIAEELQIVMLDDGQYFPPINVGWETMKPELIPCVVEKTFDADQKYLDWNPEFEAAFFANFGTNMWQAFQHCCVQNNSVLDLTLKMHYNLS